MRSAGVRDRLPADPGERRRYRDDDSAITIDPICAPPSARGRRIETGLHRGGVRRRRGTIARPQGDLARVTWTASAPSASEVASTIRPLRRPEPSPRRAAATARNAAQITAEAE